GRAARRPVQPETRDLSWRPRPGCAADGTVRHVKRCSRAKQERRGFQFIKTNQHTARTMRPLCMTYWWLGLLATVGAATGPEADVEGTEDGSQREYIYLNRYKRAGESPDKCTYTFIVPQQRVTGAICVNSKEPEVHLENRVHKQELELLNNELLKQKRQIETLQQLVEVDGGIVSEVKLLRKESRNMNSRVTQLYMQLLHEIIRKRDNALELSQLENRILNQTADMLQLASKYKDLEHKFQHLAMLAHNQSEVIAQLEEHCQRVPAARPMPQPPPAAPPRVYQPPTYNRIINQISTNEIQSDQNLKVLPPSLPTMPALTSLPSSTDKPSGPWRDCLQALEDGHSTSSIYLVKPENTNRLMQVWCDQRHDPGGWTVIQRRLDGSVNFFRNWETYKVRPLGLYALPVR
ncbi:angiopoietin-like 2, isoform CRA_b, partial [Mus musculus]